MIDDDAKENEKKPPYGTMTSEPDQKVGVEVGGGDKAAAMVSEHARKEGQAEQEPKDHIEAEDEGSISGRSDG